MAARISQTFNQRYRALKDLDALLKNLFGQDYNIEVRQLRPRKSISTPRVGSLYL